MLPNQFTITNNLTDKKSFLSNWYNGVCEIDQKYILNIWTLVIKAIFIINHFENVNSSLPGVNNDYLFPEYKNTFMILHSALKNLCTQFIVIMSKNFYWRSTRVDRNKQTWYFVREWHLLDHCQQHNILVSLEMIFCLHFARDEH